MNFMLKISLGLLVLCVLVWSSPTDSVAPLPSVQTHIKEQNSTDSQHAIHTTNDAKPSEIATRSSSKTTTAPALNHGGDHTTPSKLSAEQSSSPPETHGSETATVTASKKPEQPNKDEKSSASINMQIYPFALTSVAVLLFSAI